MVRCELRNYAISAYHSTELLSVNMPHERELHSGSMYSNPKSQVLIQLGACGSAFSCAALGCASKDLAAAW